MRVIFAALGLVALGACSPTIPDSGAGFNNSIDAQRARETALANGSASQPLTEPVSVSGETLEPTGSGTVPPAAPIAAVPLPAAVATPQVTTTASSSGSEDIANEAAAALALANSNSGQAPVQASPLNPAPQSYSNSGISDENDFAAVSSRQSIESDADRIEQNKSQYQQIAPTAVPTRDGDSSPNIVQYALATSNPVGSRVYSRSGMNLDSKAARNCATFPSPDQAQIAFLEAGGPQKDRRALDPDGDGFACTWDPTPFRRAVQN